MEYVVAAMDALPGRITFGIRNDEGKIPKDIGTEIARLFRITSRSKDNSSN